MPSTHPLFCALFHSQFSGKNVAWQQTEAFVSQTEQRKEYQLNEFNSNKVTTGQTRDARAYHTPYFAWKYYK